MGNPGDGRRRKTTLCEKLPVNGGKPEKAFEGEQRWPLAGRETAAASNHLRSVAGDEGGEGDGAETLEDVLVDLLMVMMMMMLMMMLMMMMMMMRMVDLAGHSLPVGERGSAREKLEDEDAKRPNVGSLVVGLVGDDLRRHVLRGPTERPSPLLPDQLLGETKVGELDVAGGVEEQVLRLEISIDDASGVEVVEGKDDAGDIEGGGLVREPPTVPQQRPKLTSEARLHQHVQVFWAVECLVHFDYERASTLQHDLFLVEDVLLLLHIFDLILFKFLEGKRSACGSCSD